MQKKKNKRERSVKENERVDDGYKSDDRENNKERVLINKKKI